MSRDSTETTIALDRWRTELATHRQPWSEWDALESLAHDGDFDLVTADHVPFEVNFLASPPDEQGYRISHLIVAAKQSTSLAKVIPDQVAFPKYLPALLDLKWADILMLAGGIASYLNVYEDHRVEPPTAIGPESLKRDTNLIQYLDPDTVTWPDEPTYCFQTNHCGGIFCSTSSGRIVSFSARAKQFVAIGSIDEFVRYCLMCILERRDWFRSYSARYRIDEYHLTFVDDAGID